MILAGQFHRRSAVQLGRRAPCPGSVPFSLRLQSGIQNSKRYCLFLFNFEVNLINRKIGRNQTASSSDSPESAFEETAEESSESNIMSPGF